MIKHGDKTIFQSNVCLKKIPDDSAYSMVGMYAHYSNNLLPNAGGILDQPKYFMDAMKIIRGIINSG